MSEGTIVIDGSQGEGGGQILRTSAGLAAALGQAVKIVNIRANRPRPGMAAQHLAAVRAAAAICGGDLQGDQIGSRELLFRPGPLNAGEYRFAVGTAGSTLLVIQTILPGLMVADGQSQVTVTGGTHNPMAPCFEYVRDVFAVLAAAANLQAHFQLLRPGFYPAGGGEILLRVQGLSGAGRVGAMRYVSRGELRRIDGLSLITRSLPEHIVRRQAEEVSRRLEQAGLKGQVQQMAMDGHSPGTAVFVRAAFSRSVAGFTSLGRRGRPAEAVADEAVDALLAFLASSGAVDAHAADQLITLAALCPRESRIAAERVTRHLLTNAQVIRQVTGRNVLVEGDEGRPGTVVVAAATAHDQSPQ